MLLAIAFLSALGLPAANPEWTVDINKPTVRVSKDLYGIFFEEINCAGDGGLYAELVRNRGFEDSDQAEHWNGTTDASFTVDSAAGERVLNLKGPIGCGISNNGYWGIAVEAGRDYHLSVRVASPYPSKIGVQLRAPDGQKLAEGTISAAQVGTQKLVLRAKRSETNASLYLTLAEGPHFCIDDVSLFPDVTFMAQPNGMRTDLAAMLNELKPGFMRFPGGCWVEGDTMATAYRWKTTIGNLGDRSNVANLWKYKSTNGLGYHEYLQLCEDLRAAPMFVVNCGMSHREVVPMDKMDEFVQDALDAIEYANGPVTSKWGAVRAANGHPKPFNLKYLEIGNENGGPAYEERYGLIFKAVKAKYPEIQTIACLWGGSPRNTPIEILDEHYYNNPEFFIQNADRYDRYDRKGPKIYVGEYAVTLGVGNGNLRGAVAEAAFMTGMERNSDIVVMSSYAPLFANVNLKVWNPDLIYFDGSRVAGTPSYYVQKMFSRNRADQVLSSKLDPGDVTKEEFPSGGIGVATWNTQSEFKDIKVVSKEGKVLLDSPDGSLLKSEKGTWIVDGGVLKQTSPAQPAIAWAGDTSWHDYTLTMKARRLSGAEGFIAVVGRKSPTSYLWFNVGGWGNREHGIEHEKGGGKSRVGNNVQGSVNTGEWVDVKVLYSPERMTTYLNGKQITSEAMPNLRALHGVAGKMDDGTIVLKLVNSGNKAQKVTVKLNGSSRSYTTEGSVLTSRNSTDENTLDQPEKVVPKPLKAESVKGSFVVDAPANSVIVLKLKR